MNIKKFTICFILIVVSSFSIFTLGGCTNKSDDTLIRERINGFVEAFNNGDTEAVIDCLDSKTATTVKSALNIGDSLIGNFIGVSISIKDIFGFGANIVEDNLISIKEIMSVEIDISNNEATAVVINDRNEQSIIYLIKENNNWKINSIEDIK